MKKVKPSKGTAVALAADLRIASAREAYESLERAARGTGPLVAIDASGVEKVDAAGIQAVAAGVQAIRRSGKALTWKACSAPLRSASELLGLAGTLELPA